MPYVTSSSTSAANPGPRPRGAARREALLEAVLTLVAQQGTDAVTHRRVAETAGLPLASTTYWFQSKDHLLAAALELAAERDIARLRASAVPVPGEAPLETAVRAIAPPPELSRTMLLTTYALLIEAARRPGLRDVSERWTEAYLETIGDLFAQAGSAQPREDAALLLAATDGLELESLSTGGPHGDFVGRLHRLARLIAADA